MFKINPWKVAFFAAVSYIIAFECYWRPPQSRCLQEILGDEGSTGFKAELLAEPFAARPQRTLDYQPSLHSPARQLASSEAQQGTHSSVSAGSSSGSHGSHDNHPHDALFFLFNAIIIGTIILHLTTLPKLHSMQQTVCLFVLGIIYALVQEGFNAKKHLGKFGVSFDMWMAIDPHLLLFTLLPALLAGDAMTIDTSVARSVANQCLFLAGPGVIFGSFSTAGFLYFYLPYDWDFRLCLVSGSILAATDPVAVVGLLKELGASPKLTIQIQGESLLNDGTAIVLYTVAYNMLKGEDYDAEKIMIYVVLCAGCAMGLGALLGYFFFRWIKLADNKFDHHAGLIQTALTICCAYWSFCIAEGMLHWSGVLCTVSASLVLADKMWPEINDKESLLHIWHAIEYLGNTIIFFLAGTLTGNAMVHIPAVDYAHLLVIYVAASVIRAVLLFGTRPILTALGDANSPVTLSDVTVMTWGGLRGAVGLALAIQVRINRANNQLDDVTGQRVLFYVGGIATLTLCVNATTCPALVRKLGITKTPATKQKMLCMMHRQLAPLMDAEDLQPAVKKSMTALIDDVAHHIDHLVPERAQEAEKQSGGGKLACVADLCDRFDEAKNLHKEYVKTSHMRMIDMPSLPLLSMESKLEECVREQSSHVATVKTTNEAFLSLLRSEYWRQLDDGGFLQTEHATLLLRSVAFAFQNLNTLHDFQHLLEPLQKSHAENGIDDSEVNELLADEEAQQEAHLKRQSYLEGGRGSARCSLKSLSTKPTLSKMSTSTRISSAIRDLPFLLAKKRQERVTWLSRFIDSVQFNVSISVLLILNAVFILIEQTQRTDANRDNKAWISIEIFFAVAFTVEFALKFADYRCYYFLYGWNVFDFVLLNLSYFGVVMEFVADGYDSGNNASKEARIFRLNRLFRVLRILRLFRLFKFAAVLAAKLRNEDISFKLAEHLKTITICRAFVIAHTNSQLELLRFFGNQGQPANAEQARCLMESQTEVYKALVMAAAEADSVDNKTLIAMKFLRENIESTGKLRKFIDEAHGKGIIGARESETVTHVLNDRCRVFNEHMKTTVGGRSGANGTAAPPEMLEVLPVPQPKEAADVPDGMSWAVQAPNPEARSSTEGRSGANGTAAPPEMLEVSPVPHPKEAADVPNGSSWAIQAPNPQVAPLMPGCTDLEACDIPPG